MAQQLSAVVAYVLTTKPRERRDHAESHDGDVIGYLTTDAGQIEPAKPAKPAIETDRSHSY